MDPFIGQMLAVCFPFAPKGWAICAGQSLPIAQNQDLFKLLGTTYGGDGQSNFQLPDLRGRVASGNGGGFRLGEQSGEENHTLLMDEMPGHTHTLNAAIASAGTNVPTGNLYASGSFNLYGTPPNAPMNGAVVANVGGSQAHSNQQPYLAVNWIIALQGTPPTWEDAYIGQLMLVPYDFAPAGFAFCEGQLLPVAGNTALFSVIQTRYGGDGKTNFGLPDLRGAIPISGGQGPGLQHYTMGQKGGVTTVTLQQTQMPQHTHAIMDSPAPIPPLVGNPVGNAPGQPAAGTPAYAAARADVQMNAGALSPAGGNAAHNNVMPTLTMNWIIALKGIYPPRS